MTLAQGSGQTTPPPAPVAVEAEKPDVLVVPDVRRQAYVFAKGILQDAGFAWRVQRRRGRLRRQHGRRADAGARRPRDRQRRAGGRRSGWRAARSTPSAASRRTSRRSQGRRSSSSRTGRPSRRRMRRPSPRPPSRPLLRRRRRLRPRPRRPRPPAPATTEPTTTAPAPAAPPAQDPAYRKPDFTVSGAPGEPTAEMPLPARATRARGAGRQAEEALRPGSSTSGSTSTPGSSPAPASAGRTGTSPCRRSSSVDRSLQTRFGFGAKSEPVPRPPRARLCREPEGLGSVPQRLARLLRGRRGYTLIELLAVMTIFLTIVTALTALFVTGAKAELESNRRFQAQQNARIAFDQMRREIHCGSALTFTSASSVSRSRSRRAARRRAGRRRRSSTTPPRPGRTATPCGERRARLRPSPSATTSRPGASSPTSRLRRPRSGSSTWT